MKITDANGNYNNKVPVIKEVKVENSLVKARDKAKIIVDAGNNSAIESIVYDYRINDRVKSIVLTYSDNTKNMKG